jgi:hypothetical protein
VSAQRVGIVLPAHTVTVFEPAQVFADDIGERKIVYLDNNVWIDLRDGQSEAARRCYDACLRVVTEGRAVFPVSWAAVSELLELPSADLRCKQADIMDSLCGSLTFRAPALIQGLEAEDVFAQLFSDGAPRDRRHEVFTMLVDYTGDGRLKFPEGLRASDVDRFVSMWRSRDENPGLRLRWMVDHLDHEQTLRNHGRVATYALHGFFAWNRRLVPDEWARVGSRRGPRPRHCAWRRSSACTRIVRRRRSSRPLTVAPTVRSSTMGSTHSIHEALDVSEDRSGMRA